MARGVKQSSPLVGWMEAGADLVAARLVQAAELVNQKLSASHELLDELQHRGEKIDAQLKTSLQPSSIIHSFQDLIMSNPLRALLPGLKTAVSKREQQLALLSAKIDLLVEQVALLAAKQAAEKQRAKSSTSTRKAASAKSAAEKAPSTAKETASTAAKKTTTRRTTSTRKTTATRKPAASNRATKTTAKTEGGPS